jgi:hypothetical protein
LLKAGTVISIGNIHSESWDYIRWEGYSAILTKYMGYNVWMVELVDYPELTMGIHIEDCIQLLN